MFILTRHLQHINRAERAIGGAAKYCQMLLSPPKPSGANRLGIT